MNACLWSAVVLIVVVAAALWIGARVS